MRSSRAHLLLLTGQGKVTTPDQFKDDFKGDKKFEVEDDEEEEIHVDNKSTPAARAPAPAAAKTEEPKVEEEPEEEGAPKASAQDKAKAAAEKEKGTAAYKKHEFEIALEVGPYNFIALLFVSFLAFFGLRLITMLPF